MGGGGGGEYGVGGVGGVDEYWVIELMTSRVRG